MKRDDVTAYISKYGRYVKTAPENAKYYVRFPNPYSGKIFFSGDTHDLAEKLYTFANTTRQGRKMWASVRKELELEAEDEQEIDEALDYE